MAKERNANALIELFNALDAQSRDSLFDYAEFLREKSGPVEQDIGEPLEIPRPENESVVGAIKRLKQTYPMIESMSVFSVASNLMTDHMVKGRDAMEVIEEMEQIFEQAYQQMLKDMQ